MEPALVVTLSWLLFAGSHSGLAMRRPRQMLVDRLGYWGFIALFSVVAAATFAQLLRAYAAHETSGALGLAPWLPAAVRWALYSTSVVGTGIMALAIFRYAGSPYAVSGAERYREIRGVERISRHGFFSGIFLLAVSHAFLAHHLVGAVFWAIFALYAWLGSVHQDRKLVRMRGKPHEEFVKATSFLPFVATLEGRQAMPWREVSLLSWGLAAACVFLVRLAHPHVLAAGGMGVVGTAVGGAALVTFQAWRVGRRQQRRARRPERGRTSRAEVRRAQG